MIQLIFLAKLFRVPHISQLFRPLDQLLDVVGHVDLGHMKVWVSFIEVSPYQLVCGHVEGYFLYHESPCQHQADVFKTEFRGELLHEDDGDWKEKEGEDGVDVEQR